MAPPSEAPEHRKLEYRHELLLRAAGRAAPMGWFVHDLETNELTLNDALRSRLVPKGTATTVLALAERLLAGERDRVREVLDSVLRGVPRTMSLAMLLADDTVGHLVVSGELEAGPRRTLIGVVLDVTERVALEAQLHQAQKMAALGQIAAGSAHDFNNLLAVILAQAEMIRRQCPDAGLDDIVAAARAASDISTRLLAVSRRSDHRPVELCLAEVVHQWAALARPTFDDSVSLEVKIHPELPRVRADRTQVQQILLNLGINARDAMPDGGILRVDVKPVTRDGSPWVEVAVSDTGIGIEPAILSRVFDPFFTTKKVGEGSGLGLSTAMDAARDNDGVLTATSVPGEGSTFCVSFPAFPGHA